MINLNEIEKYKENNRIEAKKALGGLPNSIWETYSSFANTLGGVILLGVEEYKDKSLHVINLPNPLKLVEEFWEKVNKKMTISSNILSKGDVRIEKIEGKQIIAIYVPKAERSDKPVFIGSDPYSGTYRRNGEGDYRCTKEEVDGLIRDASLKTLDMRIIDKNYLDVFNFETVRSYQKLFLENSFFKENLDYYDLLNKIGAIKGTLPTVAGLLMFGLIDEIIKEFPHFSLQYHEFIEDEIYISSLNIFDFYKLVYEKVECPLEEVTKALREALANTLIHADYYAKGVVKIIKTKEVITFSNPGRFHIDALERKPKQTSIPRNRVLIKMFNLIGRANQTGSGLAYIYSVWNNQNLKSFRIEESFNPDKITLILPLSVKGASKEKANDVYTNIYFQKQVIINYLTKKVMVSITEISDLLGITEENANDILLEMINEDIIIKKLKNCYMLKA